MKKTFQAIFVWLMLIGMPMVGCTDDWGMTRVRPSDVVCFTATLGGHTASGISRSTSGHLAIEEEEWQLEGIATQEKSESRAVLTTTLNGSANVIGVSNEILKFSFRGDELLSDGNPVYWKDMNKQNFNIYAYAPHDVTNVDDGDKTISFQVADDVTKQKDVIVATREVIYHVDAGKSDFNKSIPLTFNHILTAVRFKLGFDAAVETIKVSGVKNQGIYSMENGTWTGQTGSSTYEISSTADGNELLMIPQTFTSGGGAKVTLVCKNGIQLEAPLEGQEWKPGKLITYTLYQGTPPACIYLDLAAADVKIEQDKNDGNKIKYKGMVYTDATTKQDVSGEHQATNVYYVYQSTEDKRKEGKGIYQNGGFTPLEYGAVSWDGKPWRDYITNNPSVENVIHAWDNKEGTSGAAYNAGRKATKNRIQIDSTGVDVNLIIDNIYSSYQDANVSRTNGSLSFVPDRKSTLTIHMKGDNRLGCIHYSRTRKGSQLIFEGTGSLTVADADYNTTNHNGENKGVDEMNDITYFSNHWCAAIGNNDSDDHCYGIVVNSGTLFAGTTKAENCTAIGGGGNGYGEVTINGGTITAVAATTGTAIGGGIGFNSPGGEGKVTICNGNVYAYNHANRWDIPSSAIGGAGSKKAKGNKGTVIITGGNVYAQSAIGTAIGGGSSYSTSGGEAEVIISGGKVVAKSKSSLSEEKKDGTIIPAGSGIGGGTGSSSTGNASGGNAKVTISGNPIIRTGSIGGGRKGEQSSGTIGSAEILIMEGSTADIQAQFVLAAGTGENATNKFEMNGGTLRNSNTFDKEYEHVHPYGGAVCLENGVCIIGGGSIENCTAEIGGAIYIAGTYNETEKKYEASFTMRDGTIKQCTSKTDGGAVYLKGGNITLTGGTISNNLAQDGNGGGFYLMEGNFEMSNATITKNSAIYRHNEQGNGGGVYITSSSEAKENVRVTIASGSIVGNTSDRKGGGICVVMPEVSNEGNRLLADVTVGNDDAKPNISGNNAVMKGGGLYVEGQGTFVDNPTDNSFYGFNTRITINNGKINGNSTTAYVPNNDIVNEKGIVALNNDDNVSVECPYVTITFHGNGGKTEGQESYKQKLVTFTNNILILPEFKHSQNTVVKVLKWNTRADGQGDDYDYRNGASINLSKDLELYAQWGE